MPRVESGYRTIEDESPDVAGRVQAVVRRGIQNSIQLADTYLLSKPRRAEFSEGKGRRDRRRPARRAAGRAATWLPGAAAVSQEGDGRGGSYFRTWKCVGARAGAGRVLR